MKEITPPLPPPSVYLSVRHTNKQLSSPPAETTYLSSAVNFTLVTCAACPIFLVPELGRMQGNLNNLIVPKSSPETKACPSWLTLLEPRTQHPAPRTQHPETSTQMTSSMCYAKKKCMSAYHKYYFANQLLIKDGRRMGRQRGHESYYSCTRLQQFTSAYFESDGHIPCTTSPKIDVYLDRSPAGEEKKVERNRISARSLGKKKGKARGGEEPKNNIYPP